MWTRAPHVSCCFMISYLRSSSCSHAAMLVKSSLQLVMACNSSPNRAPSFSLMSFMVSERERRIRWRSDSFRWRLVWAPTILVYFYSSYFPWRITKKIVFYLNPIVYCRQSLNHAKGNLSKFGLKLDMKVLKIQGSF